MRRITWIIAALVATGATGAALAHGFESKSVKAVSATFTATNATNLRTATCTGSDGTYVTTFATYTGNASGDTSLTGPLTINAHSLINSTTNIGFVRGRIHIEVSGHDAGAGFTAVYSNGTLSGFAFGHAGDPFSGLLANVSAGFSGSGGFTSGMLGGGTTGGGAVEITRGGCRPIPPPRPERIVVHGNVTAVSATSITVAGVTCNVTAGTFLNLVTNVHVGDRVEIACIASGGTNTLNRIGGDHHHH